MSHLSPSQIEFLAPVESNEDLQSQLEALSPIFEAPIKYTDIPKYIGLKETGIAYSQKTARQLTLPIKVPIYDGRDLPTGTVEEQRALMKQTGFCLTKFSSSIGNHAHEIDNPSYYHNDAKNFKESQHSLELRKRFIKEVEEHVKNVVGADYIVGQSHMVREGMKGSQMTGVEFLQAYAAFAHCDHTDFMADPKRARKALWYAMKQKGVPEGSAAEELTESPEEIDVCFYNLWMPTRAQVQQYPLAFLDYSSMQPEDWCPVRIGTYSDMGMETDAFKKGDAKKPAQPVKKKAPDPEVNHVGYNKDHRWFIYSGMEVDEALIFTQLNPRLGHAKHNGHTACFVPLGPPPLAPENARRRTSIEVRLVAGFKKNKAFSSTAKL